MVIKMAHTTSGYYRDRLGFEPEYESRLQQSSSQQQTSVTKSTLYSSGLTAASSTSRQQSSTSQTTKAAVHQASYQSSSSNHYSSSRDQQAITTGADSTIRSNHSTALDTTYQSGSGSSHGVYEENLTKFKGSN